ncbi:MAG: hypothetical protein K2Q45_03275 [Nitrosomonas sp.]|nr:hypothetical protein [Nitrosomonas sp.]
MSQIEDVDDDDAMFLQNVAATAHIVGKRMNDRAIKDGEVAITAIVEAFIHESQEPVEAGQYAKKLSKSYPPMVRMIANKTKPGQYPAKLELYATIDKINESKDQVRFDAATGKYQVKSKCGFIGNAAAWLKNNHAKIMSDSKYSALRDYFKDDNGEVITEKWRTVGPGDRFKFKHSGKEAEKGKEERNIFRKMVPGRKSLYFIQPGAKVHFINVHPEVWIVLRKERNAPANTEAAAESAAQDAGDNAETVGMDGMEIVEYLSFDCKSNAKEDEAYDPELSYSERLHLLKNPDVHNLVHIRLFEQNPKLMPRSAYFFLRRIYRTQWSPETASANMPGVTIVRDSGVVDPVTKLIVPRINDFMNEYQDKQNATCNFVFSVFQWNGRAHTQDRFVVKVIGKGDDLWRKFGITNMTSYAYIAAANEDLPLHISASIWQKNSINHPSNQNDTLNNGKELENIRGYYTYFMNDITPDYLRFFKEQGMRLSPEFVRREFDSWESENKKTGQVTINLKPLDTGKANPLNVHGIMSDVLSLGNGLKPEEKQGDAKIDRSVGVNHAYNGDIIELFEGKHDFYFLQSKPLAQAEKNLYSGPGGKIADEFLDNLKTTFKVYYWIFAVRREAKTAQPKVVPAVAVVGAKRERAEDTATVNPDENVSEVKKQALDQ